MPSKSDRQHRFMAAIAHSPSFAKKVGVPQSVGKDFSMADKKKGKYAEGGMTQAERDRQKTGVKIAMVDKKMQDKANAAASTAPKYAKGGKADKAGRALVKKSADTMGRAMKFAKGGLAGGHKSADGIAKKGKTKGLMPKMNKGGMC